MPQQVDEPQTTLENDRRLARMVCIDGEQHDIARLKQALRDIRALAEASSFGSWRFKIAAIVDRALPNG